MASKHISTSITWWGILAGIAEIVSLRYDLLVELVGNDYADLALSIASLILVAVGRHKASQPVHYIPKGLKGSSLLLFLPLLLVIPGCGGSIGGQRQLANAGYRSDGASSNLLLVNPDRSTVQDYQVEPPAAVIASSGNVENYGSVPFGQVSALLPDGTTLVSSVPNDFDADEIIVAADGSVTIRGVRISTSEVVVARASFIQEMLPIIEAMTTAQKETLIAQYELQASVGNSFAQGILPILKALATGG